MNGFDVIVIGPPCIDEYYELDSPLVTGDKVIGKFMGNKLGGMISNAATIMASYDLKVSLIDAMNHSPSSMQLVDALRANRVDTSLIGYDDKLSDSKCIIFLHQGERTILVVENNKSNLQISNIQKESILHSQVLYTTINDIARYNDSVSLLQIAKENGIKIVFDIEYSTLAEKDTSILYLQLADIIFVNEGGVRALVDCYGDEFLHSLVDDKGMVVVKTVGARGCIVMSKGRNEFLSPAFPVQPVDTTGAGDTFNSTFVYGVLHGWTLERCARIANGAASRAIMYLGAQSGSCGIRAVNEFIGSFEKQEFETLKNGGRE